VPNHTPVKSAGAGIIAGYGKSDDNKLGCWVAIKHSATAYTIYGHLDCNYIYVQAGDPVTHGTTIADSDDSGKGTGPHLHMELYDGYPGKLVGFKNYDSKKVPPQPSGVFLLPPPSPSEYGHAINPLCGGRKPPPAPKLPPPLPPVEDTTVGQFPHDPNAMLGPEGYVTPGQAMTYTVMFENEGAGTAFDVYVTDIFDGNLDDSNIVVKDFYLVDWATNTETPTTLPYSYDPQSHKLTVLAGTFDSRKGGKFTVELRLRPDVPQGTVVKNFATVYFPTALEETRTNSIISAVPQPALVAYTGSTVAVYSSYAMLAATVTSAGQTLLGKTVTFNIGNSSFTAVTGGYGEASVYVQVDVPPGIYQLSAAFPGDGYYYTSSTRTATLQVLKAETFIADFSTITYSANPVISVSMTNSKGVQILHQDAAPKTVYLEYRDGEAWKPLGQTALSSGTAVFQFPLPQPPTAIYHLKAKFSGDDNYSAAEATATLMLVDIEPPAVTAKLRGEPISDGSIVYMVAADTLTIAAVDTLSGVKNTYYIVDTVFSTQTAMIYSAPFTLPVGTHTVYYSAVDNAGNQAGIQSALITVGPVDSNIDTVPPVSVFNISGTSGRNGWHISGVGAAISALDNSAGVRETFYSLDGSGFTVYGSSFAVSSEGLHTLEAYSIDNASNVENVKTIEFGIDVSTPVITYSRVPAANPDGWNNAQTAVVFTATDTLSGIEYCSSSFTIMGEGENIPASGYCMDYAGWSSTAALTVSIDATPPSIFISSPASGGKYAGADIIKIDFAVSDSLSLVRSSAAYLRQIADNGTPRGSLPDIIPAAPGQSLAVSSIDDGVWELIATATDYAGNYSYASGGTFEVMHATVQPAGATIKLNLEPDTLNLTSKGEAIAAGLKIVGGNTLCFNRAGISISAINGYALKKPIYALNSGRDNDGHGHGDDDFTCGSITVKFDREALIAVLPVNARVKVTVSGGLTNKDTFSADDTIRTIKPRRATRREGGRFEHSKRASVDVPALSLKQDDDLYVLDVEGDIDEREASKAAAAKAGKVERRGYAYEFGPEGAVFDKPVTISLPYDSEDKSPEKLAVAYWNEAASSWETLPSRRDTAGRLVKADVPHFSQYQVVAASYAVSSVEALKKIRVSDDGDTSILTSSLKFKLGEVYVYPNPAKGGKVPVFHIEVGEADTVKIRVFTVAGQLTHEATVSGMPQAIGSTYAYEYAWGGHIASGVYYYTVEAVYSGKKIKTKGKFAVIR